MKKIIKQSVLALLLQLIYIDSMVSQKQNSSSNTPDSLNVQSSRIPSQPILYYIDLNNDGIYENTQLKEELKPFIGYERFTKKLLSTIKYPALEKESGIEGNVILEVFVDETGKVQKVNIKQGISKECDEEAKKGFIKAAINGYALLKIDSKPVKYKMDFPFKFSLQ